MKEIIIEAEGNIVFKEIKYAGNIITFKDGEELKVKYAKYGEEDFINIEYDFGMVVRESNERTGFIKEDTSIEELVRRTVKYDVEHAFCHPYEDPNYGEIHWAIKGWLKERILISEDTNIEMIG